MWPITREETPRLFGSNAANAILADAHNINTIARITGIPALAIAGPVAREIDLAQNSWIPSASSAPTSSQQVYNDYQQAVINNRTTTGFKIVNKLWNDALLDLGPGKIKPATAIHLILSYYIDNPKFANDNLDLAKYVDHWDAFVKDMQDSKDRTSYDLAYKIYALSALQASDWYSQRVGETGWNRLTDAQKAAFITTFDAIGLQRMNELANKQIEDNGVYAPYPGSPGARTILFDNGKNVRLLNQLLGMGGATTADANDYAGGVVPASHAFPSPELPYWADGLPDSASPDLSNPPGKTPQYGYWLPQSGWPEAPATPASLLTPQPFSPASIAPGVRPTENAHSSFALAAQAPDARPSPGNGILSGLSAATGRGNGILSGLTPADAWPSPGNGRLGGLGPAAAGSSGSGSAEGDDHPWWAQTLQEMWLRRLQDDPSLDDSNR